MIGKAAPTLLVALLMAGSPAALDDGVSVWRDVNTPGRAFMIGDHRFVEAEDERVVWVARIASHDGDRYTLCSWGRPTVMELEPSTESGSARMHFAGSDAAYDVTPIEVEMPEVLKLEPMLLPSATPLAPNRLAELREELRARATEDQRVRTDEVGHEEWQRVDRGNTDWIRGVLAEVGWIDRERFGSEANNQAFLLVQHSGDLAMMQAVVPLLADEDGQNYALMYDRLQIGLAKPQRYGTQIGIDDDGRQGLLEIEDLEHVDDRRSEVGLPPLAEYLELFGLDEAVVLSCP